MQLDDPRLAQLITSLVDRRVRAILDLSSSTRYGIVSAVDVANRRVTVLLGDSSDPSPGFVYPARYTPLVGDRVRVVIRGADRYVDDDLALPDPHPHEEPSPIGRSIAGTSSQNATTAATLRLTHQTLLWGDSVTGYSSGSVQIAVAGLYAVTAHAEIQSNASGPWRILAIGRAAGTHPTTWGGFGEPTNHAYAVSYSTPGLGTHRHHAAFVVPLSVGDWLASFVYQDSGATLTVTNQLLTVVRLGAMPPGALLARIRSERPEATPQREATK
jgi:hypothetical protein